jgi:DNA mismatch endonuclease (patch repair protein)
VLPTQIVKAEPYLVPLIPTTNRKFWLKKIQNNMKRDKTVSSELRKSGWKVVRVWEHEVKKRIPKSIICSFSK